MGQIKINGKIIKELKIDGKKVKQMKLNGKTITLGNNEYLEVAAPNDDDGRYYSIYRYDMLTGEKKLVFTNSTMFDTIDDFVRNGDNYYFVNKRGVYQYVNGKITEAMAGGKYDLFGIFKIENNVFVGASEKDINIDFIVKLPINDDDSLGSQSKVDINDKFVPAFEFCMWNNKAYIVGGGDIDSNDNVLSSILIFNGSSFETLKINTGLTNNKSFASDENHLYFCAGDGSWSIDKNNDVSVFNKGSADQSADWDKISGSNGNALLRVDKNQKVYLIDGPDQSNIKKVFEQAYIIPKYIIKTLENTYMQTMSTLYKWNESSKTFDDTKIDCSNWTAKAR